MLPALITTLLWSSCVIAARRSVQQLGENQANLARIVLALGVLGAIAHGLGQGLGGGGLYYFILSGVVGFGLGDIGIFYALPRIGSRLTLLMAQCIAAPIAGFLEWFWLGTTISGMQVLAIAIILCGIVMALWRDGEPLPGLEQIAYGRRYMAGLLFGLLAAFGQGAGAVLSRKAYSLGDVDAVASHSVLDSLLWGATAGYQRLIGGTVVVLVFFLLSYVIRSWRSYPDASAKNVSSIKKCGFVALNAAAGPVFGIIFFQWALATTPSAVVQPIVAMTPIVVLPMAWWWEGDRPKARSVLGALLSVAGVILLAFA